MKKTAPPVRLGVIGLGAMGHPHVGFALNTPEVVLSAVADIDSARFGQIRETYYGNGTEKPVATSQSAGPILTNPSPDRHFPTCFDSAEALLDSGLVDAVLIVTPHFSHEAIALAAFSRGIHVLCEKPLSVTLQAAQTMVAAWETARLVKPDLRFGVVFMQRTYEPWRHIKRLVDEGVLGRIVRTTWIVTDWFRTESYYQSGGWRATWNGEGGGVLMNQSPHNLDLLQWFLGLPQDVIAFGGLGKYHNIEVEDEVGAFLRYSDGSVAHFLTSTAESPGTNRLEIVGEGGRVVFEKGVLTLDKNSSSMLDFSARSSERYNGPTHDESRVVFPAPLEGGHRRMLENFARAIQGTEELIAPGSEGLGQVALTNALLASLLTGNSPIALAEAGTFAGLLRNQQSVAFARTRES